MAWSIPITFSVGVQVTHSSLNLFLRDNLVRLGTHFHNDQNGNGGWQMGGNSYDLGVNGIVSITFIDGAVPGTPAGIPVRMFTTATMVGIISSGGAATYLANSTHTHAGL